MAQQVETGRINLSRAFARARQGQKPSSKNEYRESALSGVSGVAAASL
ncbi:MAG: hypothetical protein R3245_11910 [Kiloniellales bacterium]|nr:hypothetical protein [Kiloniellales bacterium]